MIASQQRKSHEITLGDEINLTFKFVFDGNLHSNLATVLKAQKLKKRYNEQKASKKKNRIRSLKSDTIVLNDEKSASILLQIRIFTKSRKVTRELSKFNIIVSLARFECYRTR